jgi:hypothetical protein
MAINPGKAEQVIREVTTGPGSTTRDSNLLADSLMISVWIPSVTSGNLTITVYNVTDSGSEVELMVFPTISAPSTDIYLRKLKLSSPNYRVRAVYTGICSYEIQAKAVTGPGETSMSMLGSNSWSVGQVTMGISTGVLIPAAIQDRRGFIIRNFSTSGQVIYIGESAASAVPGTGFPIPAGEVFTIDVASGAEVYACSSGAGADVRYAQAGG